jgi:hypothetical protein
MNKELKLLLVSILLIVIGIIALYLSSSNPPVNCWSQYTTEHDAIMACEGK